MLAFSPLFLRHLFLLYTHVLAIVIVTFISPQIFFFTVADHESHVYFALSYQLITFSYHFITYFIFILSNNNEISCYDSQHFLTIFVVILTSSNHICCNSHNF